MENRNNKLVAIIIGLAALVLALLGVIIYLVAKEKPADNSTNVRPKVNTTETTATATEPEGFFAKEVEDAGSDDKYVYEALPVVIDGFEFTCPPEYACAYYDNIGPVIYVDDVFQMKIVVRDGSNADTIKDKASLTEKTIAAGGTILKDVTEATVNGRTYTYFRMELEGEENVVAYAPAPGDKKRFGGQIVVYNSNLSDEDYLAVFDKIVTSAVATDKPNSTADDLYGRDIFIAPGEEKATTTLTFKKSSITVAVPEGFYSTFVDTTDMFIIENFCTAHVAVSAELLFYGEDPGFGGLDAYMENCVEELKVQAEDKVDPKITTKKVGANTVKYILATYRYYGETKQEIIGATEFSNGELYVVRAFTHPEESETEITWDMMEKFFEIQ